MSKPIDYVARAKARLNGEADEAKRRYEAAEPDRRQLVDWHAEYLSKRDGITPVVALERSQVQAVKEGVL